MITQPGSLHPETDELLAWRREFPILDRSVYLISNSLGAMPLGVYDRMREYAETWATRGVRAWGDLWWEMPVTVGNTIAPLIGAGKDEVSMHPNVSLIEAILLSCFEFSGKRKNIVLSEMEFPSVMYVYEKFAAARGAKIRAATSHDGVSIPVEDILKLIDDRTLLVPISHVLFKSAYIQDVKAIVEKAHRHGALVLLDAYHSVGVMPVDVRKLGVDILIGGVLKWLCGGPGGAFLWIRPSLRKKLEPKITGWCAHRNPFGFETSHRYESGARRFLNGTPAIPALYAAQEGPKIIAQIGMGKIRAKSIRQTSLVIDEAENCGYEVVSPRDCEQRGGTVTIKVPHSYEVSRELVAREILVDFRRGAGIRLAPHFYTSDDEIRHAIKNIREIIETKAYKKHMGGRETVT